MNFLCKILTLFRRRRLDTEMAEEMRHHLEEQTAANLRAGMPPEEARWAALRAFGHVDGIKERARDQRGWRVVEDCWRDLGLGLRFLVKSPGFTLATVLTLGLGVATMAIAAVFYDTIHRSDIPHARNPERIVTVLSHAPDSPWNIQLVSIPVYEEWRAQARSFSAMTVFGYYSEVVRVGGQRRQMDALRVAPGYFEVLGVQPFIGRTFTEDDARSTAPLAVIISHRIWQDVYGGATDLAELGFELSDRRVAVIGVMPPRFDLPHNRDFWIPLHVDATLQGERGQRWVEVIARLREDVELESANAEMAAIAAAQAQAHPQTEKDSRARVIAYRDLINVAFRRDVEAFLGSAAIVLLLVSVNVGGLLLVRYVNRSPQLALRAALGASRGRIMRSLLAESVLLTLSGLVVGAILAAWVKPVILRAVAPEHPFPQWWQFDLNARVLFATALAELVFMSIIGLFIAWRCSRVSLMGALRLASPTTLGGRGAQRLRTVAVGLQVAVTVALLAMGALLLGQVRALRQVDLGVDPDGVVFLASVVPRALPPAESSRRLRQIVADLGGLPGVEAVGAASVVPGVAFQPKQKLRLAGNVEEVVHLPSVAVRDVIPGTLAALGIPRLRGRDFSIGDTPESEPVALIDAAFAERYFTRTDPLGQRVAVVGVAKEEMWLTIIGVVGSTRINAFRESEPTLYGNWYARPTARRPEIVIKTAADPAVTLAEAAALMRKSDPDAAVIARFGGLYRTRIEATFYNHRLRGHFMAGFALLALVTALMGLSGLMAYAVSQRTREIGVRLAFGATPRRIVREFCYEGVRLVLGGLIGGLLLIGLLSTWLNRRWGIAISQETGVIVLTAGSLLAIGTLACVLSVRRATKVDPLAALRVE